MPKIVLHMPPVSQQRHRDIPGTKKKYNPNKQEKNDWKLLIISALHQEGITKPYKGPIRLELYFQLAKPKKGAPIEDGEFYEKRPDIDNFIKLTMDALNKVLFEDDCQVVQLLAQKIYSDHPKTIILFNEL